MTAHPEILHLPTTQALVIQAACSGRTVSVGDGHGLHRTQRAGLPRAALLAVWLARHILGTLLDPHAWETSKEEIAHHIL